MQNTDEEGTASKPKRVRLGTSANGLNEGQQQQLSNEKLKALPLADENLVDIVTFLSRDDQDPVTITTRQLQRAIKQMKEPTLRRLHAVLIHAGGADIRTASDDEEPNEINSVEEAFRWADCSYVKTLTLGGLTWTETDGRSIDTAFRALTIKTESVEIEGCSFKRAPADVLHYIARLCIPGGSFRMVR
ncbi:hypothetical protein AAVH_09452 [Aphelenchoides avenae]|nr:hypothetical protein AAVH_09452 [Aphelenchus avenae]